MNNVYFSELDVLRQRESVLEKQETVIIQEMYHIRNKYAEIVTNLQKVRNDIERLEKRDEP